MIPGSQPLVTVTVNVLSYNLHWQFACVDTVGGWEEAQIPCLAHIFTSNRID